MSAEITLLSINKACEFLFKKQLEHGKEVYMYKAMLDKFIIKLYSQGYAIAECNEEAVKMLVSRDARTIIMYKLFTLDEAVTCLLFQAEKSSLPIALIKDKFIKFVQDMYAQNYYFATILDTPENLVKHKSFFGQNCNSVILELKPCQK